VRIPFDWPAVETDVRQWSAFRAFAPRLWRKTRVRRDTVGFPEVGYGPWHRRLRAAALAIHRDNPVDLVVATANPNVDFAAADELHRVAGVPYVMDYRDAWMLDVFDGDLLHPEGGRVAKLERRLLTGAREVWFVNEPIRTWHQARYPALADRMHVVSNGFDPHFAPLPRLEPAAPTRPLTFGYIGTVSGKVPLPEFAAGWRLAVERTEMLRGARAEIHGYLGFYAAPTPKLLQAVQQHADVNLSYEGPVPKPEVRAIYERFDALLLILGAGRYVTSGKVFEYAASALPIVSVHDPVNAASDVLRGYPLWFPVADLSPEAIADAVEQAAKAALTADSDVRERCREFALQFDRELQLAPRIESLARSVSSGRLAPDPAGTP
ncbi:MAG: hypothetical protein QOF57_16, partial [Frankiaceae bacterium]|nr:hypothetical protein [Frankiaceae bacterium]